VVGHHRDGLAGAPPHPPTDAGERLVQVEARGEVDDEHTERGVVVVQQSLPAPLEDRLVLVAGAPGVERVDRLESMIEVFGQDCGRVVTDLRERHADVVGEVDQQLSLTTRVVDRGQATLRRPTRVREQLHCRSQLVERLHREHPVPLEQRLIRRVVARDRTRMAERELGRGR
jgi:hypothetical protein